MDKLSEDELVIQNAVDIVRELQQIRGVDENATEEEVELEKIMLIDQSL